MCLSVQTATQQPIANLEMTSSSSAGAHSSNGSCSPLVGKASAGSDTGSVDMESTQLAASSDDSDTESSQQSSLSPEHLISSQSSSEFDPLSSELDVDSFLGLEYS